MGSPPNRVYKVNVDTAIQTEAHIGGLGIVVRDSIGRVMMVIVKIVPFISEVRYSKVEAM